MAQTNGNRAVIEELRAIVASDGDVDDQVFRRLVLAGILDIYCKLDGVSTKVADHTHPVVTHEHTEFKDMVKKGDAWGMAMAIVAGLPGVYAAWKLFKP